MIIIYFISTWVLFCIPIVLTYSENKTQLFLRFNSTTSNQVMLQFAREGPFTLSLYISFQESYSLTKIVQSDPVFFRFWIMLKIQKFMMQLEASVPGL